MLKLIFANMNLWMQLFVDLLLFEPKLCSYSCSQVFEGDLKISLVEILITVLSVFGQIIF